MSILTDVGAGLNMLSFSPALPTSQDVCSSCGNNQQYRIRSPSDQGATDGSSFPLSSSRSPPISTIMPSSIPLSPGSDTSMGSAAAFVKQKFKYQLIQPGVFEVENHFYPRVLNAQIHPTVRYFMGLSNERIIKRYCHIHPNVNSGLLREILMKSPKYLAWAGCDLMNITDSRGVMSMAVIETNSCPSGMKSTPLFEEMDEEGGYRILLQRTFVPHLPEASLRVPGGGLAVLFDKNPMETTGYAAALANLTGEEVHLVPMLHDGAQPRARFVDGVLEVDVNGLGREEDWKPIRAALRYVTQRPWSRIPANTRTLILNPLVGCLAGGRNKSVAAKAYTQLNSDLTEESGLQIKTPMTVCDVEWQDLRSWVNKLGGFAVIKIPYSNAGQGVYTITSEKEMQEFEEAEKGNSYQKFVVQSLIANYTWSSRDQGGNALYHVGTMPDKRGDIYVADLRVMVSGSDQGFKVVGIYGRKAKKPLSDTLPLDSWEMLGTNLSVKLEEGMFSSESERLLLVDKRDFNTLGLGLDNLIEAYVQTVLSVTAIDRMCTRLMPNGRFDYMLFQSVNDDIGLLQECRWQYELDQIQEGEGWEGGSNDSDSCNKCNNNTTEEIFAIDWGVGNISGSQSAGMNTLNPWAPSVFVGGGGKGGYYG